MNAETHSAKRRSAAVVVVVGPVAIYFVTSIPAAGSTLVEDNGPSVIHCRDAEVDPPCCLETVVLGAVRLHQAQRFVTTNLLLRHRRRRTLRDTSRRGERSFGWCLRLGRIRWRCRGGSGCRRITGDLTEPRDTRSELVGLESAEVILHEPHSGVRGDGLQDRHPPLCVCPSLTLGAESLPARFVLFPSEQIGGVLRCVGHHVLPSRVDHPLNGTKCITWNILEGLRPSFRGRSEHRLPALREVDLLARERVLLRRLLVLERLLRLGREGSLVRAAELDGLQIGLRQTHRRQLHAGRSEERRV